MPNDMFISAKRGIISSRSRVRVIAELSALSSVSMEEKSAESTPLIMPTRLCEVSSSASKPST